MKQTHKKDLIKKFAEEPSSQKRLFWAREMKILNDLLDMFPNMDFWQKASLPKSKSLALFRSPNGLKMLRKKYREFNYKIPESKKIKLGEKSGEDKLIFKKPKTIRQFIDEQN